MFIFKAYPFGCVAIFFYYNNKKKKLEAAFPPRGPKEGTPSGIGWAKRSLFLSTLKKKHRTSRWLGRRVEFPLPDPDPFPRRLVGRGKGYEGDKACIQSPREKPSL